MKKSIFLFFLSCFLLSFSSFTNAQRWGEKDWGFQLGMSLELGTHIQYVGFKIQGYYSYKFVQINTGNHIRFNIKNLGGRVQFIEQRLNLGAALMAGRRNAIPNFILDGINHQTTYEYGIAYNYLWYFDNIGSTQKSGGWGLHIQQFSLFIENDLFAGLGRDRFRTSYLGFNYHNEYYSISINTKLWTGDTRNTKLLNTPDSLYQLGYKDLSEKPFGRFSHGIVSASVDVPIFYGNYVSAAFGIDAEPIRNFLQNKLIHDKKFVPKKLRNPDPNYPMLNSEGLPVHNKQAAAPPKIVIQSGLNRTLTY